MKILFLFIALALSGCESVDRALLTEVKTTNGQTLYTPNPIIVGTTSAVGPAFGPYGMAGSAVAMSGLALYAAWRNRKKLDAQKKPGTVIVQ